MKRTLRMKSNCKSLIKLIWLGEYFTPSKLLDIEKHISPPGFAEHHRNKLAVNKCWSQRLLRSATFQPANKNEGKKRQVNVKVPETKTKKLKNKEINHIPYAIWIPPYPENNVWTPIPASHPGSKLQIVNNQFQNYSYKFKSIYSDENKNYSWKTMNDIYPSHPCLTTQQFTRPLFGLVEKSRVFFMTLENIKIINFL
jgi:hypothetical protein